MDKKARNSLIACLADLDESRAREAVQRLLDEGENPLDVIKTCQQAMTVVGKRYEKRDFYLSGLLMAGEIFRQVTCMCEPLMEQRLIGSETGTVLLGTVQGDIHNIGKRIVEVALRCYGFTVEDLGVDVAPQLFVERAQAIKPDIIGLSGLIAIAYTSMKETVRLLREKSDTPVIIGGSLLDQKVCDFIGADYFATDVISGVRTCQQIMKKRRP